MKGLINMKQRKNPSKPIRKTPRQLQSEILIKEELDRVYITRDGKRHLRYGDALRHIDMLDKLEI